MIKYLFLCLFVFFGTFQSSAQLKKIISQKEVSLIKNSTIMIVIDDNDIYSNALKKAVVENWTFSKYEFTTLEKMKLNYSENAEVPMFGFFDGTISYTSNDGAVNQNMSVIALVREFNTKKYYDLKGQKVVDYWSFSRGEKDSLQIYGEISFIVHQINDFLTVRENQINKVKNRLAYYDYANKRNVKGLKGKVLLIYENTLDKKFDVKDIKIKYELVDLDRINKAIINKEDVLIFYRMSLVEYLIFSPKTGELLQHHSGYIKTRKKVQEEIFEEYAKRLNSKK